MRTYAEHLDAWEAMDRLGYDGVGFNEHHTSPYGLMNSPNLLAAAAAQRTKRLKLLIYGNLLPLHDPLRLAEELAMLDCLSNGRLVSGFARGIPREYNVYGVPLARVARPVRGGLGDHLARLDRGGLLLRGQVLVLRERRDLAAARAAAAPAGVGAGHGQQGDDRVGGAPQHPDHAGPGPDPRASRGHHPLLRALPRRSTAIASRPTTSSSRPTPTSPTARPRR